MKNEKLYAVEYAGFWDIQRGEYYGEASVLNAEKVGEETAKYYADLFCSAPEMKAKLENILPSDEESERWFEDNIGVANDCSASSAIYKFRLWLKDRLINPLPAGTGIKQENK